MRVIRVGYDSQGFRQRFGGVSRYFCEMIQRLPADFSFAMPFNVTHNEYLTKAPYSKKAAALYFEEFLPYLPKLSRIFIYKIYKAFVMISRGLLPDVEENNICQIRAMVDSGSVDILHFTGPHWLGPGWRYAIGRIPYVMTVHDLIPEIFGGQEGAVRERGEALANAAHIIAVSECTKRDLIRLYDIASEKITVIYHGHKENSLLRDCAIPGINPRRYVLFVGSRGGYKNWRFLVRAIADVLIRRDMILVCTGTEVSEDEKDYLSALGVAERVKCLFCSDDELGWLYSNAHCFVYPSKYEGFGLPVLEAFSRRCPVVLSRCSCFPEIAEDAALYFDEGNEAQLRNHIESFFDERLRSELTTRGAARSRDFTWECCAQETAGVYRGVMST